MQTITQRGKRTSKPSQPAEAPFSRTAARLIQQVQAEAQAALLEQLSAGHGVTVLQPLDAETTRVSISGDAIEIHDAQGGTVEIYRRRFEPESWRGLSYMAGKWHPARWSGQQTLVDGKGRRWSRDLGDMVCDDFGNLVEVAA